VRLGDLDVVEAGSRCRLARGVVQLSHLGEPPLKEGTLGVVAGELEGAGVGVSGRLAGAEAAEEIGSGGVKVVVAVQG